MLRRNIYTLGAILLLIAAGLVLAFAINLQGNSVNQFVSGDVENNLISDDELTPAVNADVQIDLRKLETGDYDLVLLTSKDNVDGFDLVFYSQSQFTDFIVDPFFDLSVKKRFSAEGTINLAYATTPQNKITKPARNTSGELLLGKLVKTDRNKVGTFDIDQELSSILMRGDRYTLEFGEFAANAEFVSGGIGSGWIDELTKNRERLLAERKQIADKPQSIEYRKLKSDPRVTLRVRKVSTYNDKSCDEVRANPQSFSESDQKGCNRSHILPLPARQTGTNCSAFKTAKPTLENYSLLLSEFGNSCYNTFDIGELNECGSTDQDRNRVVNLNDVIIFQARSRAGSCKAIGDLNLYQ